MEPTRREFLAALGTVGTAAGAALGGPSPAEAGVVSPPKTAGATETITICPFCGVGCGQVVSVKDGKVVSIEGDRHHPINEGTLCSKGAAAAQVTNNPLRLKVPLHRAPGSDRWEEKSWGWALNRIARLVKDTRDAKLMEKDDKGQTINALTAVGVIGGCTDSNENNYLLVKAFRAGLGMIPLEQQARI